MNCPKTIRIFLCLFGLSFTATVLCETETTDYSELSLEQLLQTPVTIASKEAQSMDQSPGIISVITAEEIALSGARDLMEVLVLVPGFDIGTDTQGTQGLGVRGNWAHEGKWLLQVDGIPMNENLYGTIPLSNRFPISQISRIEIIRGPGSVLYGGTAEFAVINISTKGANELKGVEVSGVYAQGKKDYARRNIGATYGGKFGDTSLSLAAFIGESQLSERDYTDSNGTSFNMNGSGATKPLYTNMGLKYKDLEFRAIIENYGGIDRTAYGVNLSKPIEIDFIAYNFLLKYKQSLGSNLTLIPELSYIKHNPWKSLDPVGAEISGILYDKTNQRLKGSLIFLHKLSETVSATYGTEFYKDFATTAIGTFVDGNTFQSYNNTSLLAELAWKPSYFQLHTGARYEYHSQSYSSFVPRIALLKSFGSLNLKALYSRAFHAPVIENFNSNPGIKAEKTQVIETEFGYQFTQNLASRINLYHIHVKDPIVYNYAGADSYRNFDQTGTYGGEFETKFKLKRLMLTLNYSYYKKDSDNVSFYEAPGDGNLHLAFPAHKVGLLASIPVIENLSVNPSMTFYSHRVGYSFDSSTGTLAATRFPSSVVANLYLKQKNLFKNFDLGAGVHNIFDNNRVIIQPYTGNHAPIPGSSREFFINADYRIEF